MAVHVEIEKNFRGFSLKTAFDSKSSATGILGASGSGKSMTLRCICGIEKPDKGKIVINGKTVFDSEKKINLKPQDRRIGYLFQNYALFPTMTVRDNITCGFRGAKETLDAKVTDFIRRYQLEGLEDRYPSQLSGGQQQRVALARMMIGEPEVILLDEPFSSLDENLRCEMADLVRKLHHEMGLTVVMVTHDKEEAMKVSDRIALMKAGEVLQYDKPERMFYHPESRAVADYMGQTNYIFGKVENGRFVSRAVSFETQKAEGEYELMVRPSAITLTVDETERMYQIEEVMFEGETAEILLKYADGKLTVWMLHRDWMKLGVKTGELVGIKIDERQGILFQK